MPSLIRILPGVLALLLGAGTAGAAITDNRIRIGVLADVTGPYARSSGVGSMVAVELAAEDFRGTVNGRPIEVLLGDGRNNPETAVEIMGRWRAAGVDMVTDLPSSAMSLAVQQFARDTDMVILNNGAGTDLLTGRFCLPNAVHWQYNTRALASVAAAVSAEQPGARWFLITVDHAFGRGVAQDLEAAIAPQGGRLVGAVFHAFTETDYFEHLRKAQASGAEVIAVANAGRPLTEVIRQAKELGVGNDGRRLVSVMTLMQDVRQVGLYAAAGMRFVSPYYWNANDGSRRFAQRFRQRMGSMPSAAQIADYAATLHYLKAVAASGHDRGAPVVEAMKAHRVDDGITQNGHIRPDGRMVHDLYFVEVKSPGESGGLMDYFRILRTLPGEQVFPPPSPECALVGARG